MLCIVPEQLQLEYDLTHQEVQEPQAETESAGWGYLFGRQLDDLRLQLTCSPLNVGLWYLPLSGHRSLLQMHARRLGLG